MVHSQMLYGRLPGALGVDQPFYGLRESQPDPSSTPAFMDQLLDQHVQAIRNLQPQGPYQIAGWCFAGLMAYEVARRLESMGQEISHLFLLDSWCPYEGSRSPAVLNTSTHSHRQRITWLPTSAKQSVKGFKQGATVRLSLLWRQTVRKMKSAAFRFYTATGLEKPAMLTQIDVLGYEWLRQYRVQPYRGDLTLVRPASKPPAGDPMCGWGPLTTGRVRSLFVPGDKSTMFLEPNVRALAANLKAEIASQSPFQIRTDSAYSEIF